MIHLLYQLIEKSMIKLKQKQLSHPQTKLKDGQLNKQRETLSERCERLLAVYAPDRFQKLLSCYDEDVLQSETIMRFCVLSSLVQLYPSLMGEQISEQIFPLLMLVNYTFIVDWRDFFQVVRLKLSFSDVLKKLITIDKSIPLLLYLFYVIRIVYRTYFMVIVFGLAFIIFLILLQIYSMVDREQTQQQFQRDRGEKEMFPKDCKQIKLFWIFSIYFIVNKPLNQNNFFSCNSAIEYFTHFFVLSELIGCCFAFLNCTRKRRNNLKWSFFYSQAHYSELTKLYLMPYYKSAMFLIALVTLLQNVVYWLLKLQLKPYILALKESNLIPNQTVEKFRANQCDLSKRWKKYINEFQDFDDQLCCMCNNKKAIIVHQACEHVCLCFDCYFRQRLKFNKSSRFDNVNCPICSTLTFSIRILRGSGLINIMKLIFTNIWEIMRFNPKYGFIQQRV